MAKKSKQAKQLFLYIFSFVLGGIVMVCLLKFSPLLSSTGTSTIVKNGTKVYEKSSLATSIDKVYNSVVLLQCYSNDSVASVGSGFVYKVDDKYGYILTNQHVVSGYDKVTVQMNDSEEEIESKVLGGDSYLDLAVVRIDKSKVKLVAEIGKSEEVNLGDTIFTVGSPMGTNYKGSVTSGILSGKDRMVSVSVQTRSSDWIMKVLQIDASINPGNSGGPLVNVNGEVIGVCSMKLVDDEIEGMGFAIPIEYAMSHVDQLENGKEIEWPVLGISMVDITEAASIYNSGIELDSSIKEGVVVIGTQKGSGAAKSGLEVGDVVTKIDGNKVKNKAYLRYELYQHNAGDTIEVTFIRDKKEKTTKVKLGKSSD